MLTTLDEIVVLGAGVAGLTTAVTLQKCFPANKITVVGKFVPGTTSATEYTSPWAGANWISLEPTANKFAEYDRVTYIKLLQIAAESPESWVQRLPLRIFSDTDSLVKQKPWFEELVGGTTHVTSDELPPGAKAGFDMNSFMINTSVYLAWWVLCSWYPLLVSRVIWPNQRTMFAAVKATGSTSPSECDIREASLQPYRHADQWFSKRESVLQLYRFGRTPPWRCRGRSCLPDEGPNIIRWGAKTALEAYVCIH